MEPSWWARYRFYTAGRVPRGHEDWAARKLSLGRWIAILLLIEAFWWAVAVVTVVVVTGGRTVPLGLWVLGAFMALFSPFSARWYSNKARRGLAPLSAHEVLKRIGEPVPPRH